MVVSGGDFVKEKLMPLLPGQSPEVIGKNIATEIEEGGKPKAQAIAISMSKAGKTKPKPKRAKKLTTRYTGGKK